MVPVTGLFLTFFGYSIVSHFFSFHSIETESGKEELADLVCVHFLSSTPDAASTRG